MGFESTLLRHYPNPEAKKIEVALRHGAYEAARQMVAQKTPAEVIELVKASGLRGRGGAGFPTGLKWSFVPRDTGKPIYLLVNADESEPGTFKDRAIIDYDPHLLIEGTIIAAYAVGVEQCYIYIRGEFVREGRVLQEAVNEAYARGFLGESIFKKKGLRVEVTVHRGAGAYICGEETGLISSLEGKRGEPKLKPPFPAVEGYFRCPTVVNNVETLANLPAILTRGAAWFRSMGTEKSPGPKIYGVSGHVQKPGLFEGPLGLPLREVIDRCGGVRAGHRIKGVIPGGSSTPVLLPEQLDTPMEYEAIAKAGSMLGTAGVIVLDETVCVVNALWNLLRFYHHESCGQCTPCREGTGWLEKLLERLEHGHGRKEDLDLLFSICKQMVGKTICVLADAAAMPTEAFVNKFRPEFVDHVEQGRCTVAGGRHP